MPDEIRVAVAGAAGRMGREVVRAVAEAPDTILVAAVDRVGIGEDAGDLANIGPLGVMVSDDLEASLKKSSAQVLVDFTIPTSALSNAGVAIQSGVSPVVGTTGLTSDDTKRLAGWARDAGVGAVVAPNFAIGAVLMIRFAAEAARYMPDAEIIELHHENKLDSPSGTALMTAQRIAAARTQPPRGAPANTIEKVPGGRGADVNLVRVHSVRLPGYVAHQEVIFGALGQTLTIRHDSTDRRSFMPGVLLAVRKVRKLNGLVVGLEELL